MADKADKAQAQTQNQTQNQSQVQNQIQRPKKVQPKVIKTVSNVN